MKPTKKQLDFLSGYLNKNLRYRETYTEFYDHILSALETKPEDKDFQYAVDSIIADDFGGYEGMRGIETRYQKAIMGEMKKKYMAYVVEYIKLPLIGVTAMLAVLFYFITKQSWFSFIVFFFIIISMRMVASLIRGLRLIRSGYIFKSTKTSVKDSVFKWLDYVPVMLFIFVVIIHALDTQSPVVWFTNAGPVGLTIFLLLCAIHTLTYFRVYKDEFKTSIVR